MNPRIILKALFVIFLIGGIWILIVGIKQTTFIVNLLQHSAKTTGTVTEIITITSRSKHGPRTSSVPRVSFIDKDNVQVSFTSELSGTGLSYKVNQTVPVIYDSTDSKKAVIDRFMEIWFPSIMCFLAGVAFLFGSWVLLQALLIQDSHLN